MEINKPKQHKIIFYSRLKKCLHLNIRCFLSIETSQDVKIIDF